MNNFCSHQKVFVNSCNISSYLCTHSCTQTHSNMKNGVFCDVTPCGSCKNRRSGGPYRLHHEGDKNRWTRNVAVTSNRRTLRRSIVTDSHRRENLKPYIIPVNTNGWRSGPHFVKQWHDNFVIPRRPRDHGKLESRVNVLDTNQETIPAEKSIITGNLFHPNFLALLWLSFELCEVL
jgi:hypothetical protein